MMKSKIFLSGLFVFMILLFANQDASALQVRSFDTPTFSQLDDFSGFDMRRRGGGGFFSWLRNLFNGGGQQGGGQQGGGQQGGGHQHVSTPLDGGLLTLLAGAGIFYFGSRRNRKSKE